MTRLVDKIIGDIAESLKDKVLMAEIAMIKADDNQIAEISTCLNRLVSSRSRKTRNDLVKIFKEVKK